MNKFKVGDDVKHVLGEETYTVVQVTEDGFYVSWATSERPYWIPHSQNRLYTLIDQTKQLPAKFKIRIHSKEHGDVVQQWLFEQGYHWSDGKKELIYMDDNEVILNGYWSDANTQLAFCPLTDWEKFEGVEVVPLLSVSGFTIVKEEKLVDVLGKTYKQEDVEQALSGLEYVPEED